MIAADKSHQSHDRAPGQDDACEKDAGCKSLEEGIGYWFEDSIADEKNCQ